MALPGVDPKSIDIEATADDILVKAEIRHEHDEKSGEVHQCEFKSGSLFRAIRLPKKIHPERVKAEIKDGMLQLTADIAEQARAKKVSVHVA